MLKKYLIYAITVLLGIFAVCLINSVHMGKVIETAKSYVNDVSKAVHSEEDETADELMDEFYDFWHGKIDYFESVMPHMEVDKITETLSNFISSGKLKDMDEFDRVGTLLNEQFEHLTGVEKLRFYNMF